jgi:hypothetical protein
MTSEGAFQWLMVVILALTALSAAMFAYAGWI